MTPAEISDLLEPDFTDFGRMLQSIGGWTIGCQNHVENEQSVERAKERGLVQTRTHKCPLDPKGWPCFELTDAGIEEVRRLRGEVAAIEAARVRQSYRDNAAKYEPPL